MDSDCNGVSLEEILNQSPVWRRLYDTDPRYRKLWDSCKGPGQTGPPKPKVFGPVYNHWTPLHMYAVKNALIWDISKAKKAFKEWEKSIPKRGTCNCQKNWYELKLVPDFTSPTTFFEFTHLAHDTVTKHIIDTSNKGTRISLEECYAIWWMPYLPTSMPV